ncbi:hypothetical protein [Nocardioides sp. CER19]|nr:hypothetical protein [Nocardioides sp. CER19]MDH2414791.1 hypothetical protein [Nocardioides sp. CER19]
MNETPIFASVERDLQVAYDDLADGIADGTLVVPPTDPTAN